MHPVLCKTLELLVFFCFDSSQVLHYVEKPQTFVSSIINCGLYLFTPEIFEHISTVFKENQSMIMR